MLYDMFMQKVDQQRHQLLPQAKPCTDLKEPHQQQQQYINHFNSQYTPPQSTGGSEGDDAKVLEALTSRESSPTTSSVVATPELRPSLPPDIVDKHGHRIVAIIDLDDEDSNAQAKDNNNDGKDTNVQEQSPENVVIAQAKLQIVHNNNNNELLVTPTKSSTTTTINNNHGIVSQEPLEAAKKVDDDDEQIVFRRVEPALEQPPSAKKKKRKSYDEKQLRLVASLSLVSSDSESEEPPAKKPKQDPKTQVSPTKNLSLTCNVCDVSLPDEESLRVHKVTHDGHKCPQCKIAFTQEKRLVHHMRCKHRSYNGNVLKEKPRGAQDSAMTIRLRYMQRMTFYECQLCGLIDEIYKDHKEHIIKKHPIESKTLQDPIMKELKCPLNNCKWTGTQYVALCRHFLEKHDSAQYKPHLREVVHVGSFGWSAARQQEVAKLARIYQFSKRKSFFFQCKLCQKVVVGYPNHVKHLKEKHNKTKKPKEETKKEEKSEKQDKNPKKSLEKGLKNTSKKIEEKPPKKNTSEKKLKTKSKIDKLVQKLESTKQSSTKTKLQKQKDSKSCKKSPIKKSQNLDKSKLLSKQKASTTNVKVQVKLKKTKDVKEVSQNKTKQKSMEPKSNNAGAAPVGVVNNVEKPKLSGGGKRKRKDLSQLKIVKVKAPIKQIKLQSYTCRYCSASLKGFLLYSKHMQQEHSNEFLHCDNCNASYLDKSHLQQCPRSNKLTNQQKRKFVKVISHDEQHKEAAAIRPDVNYNWRETIDGDKNIRQQQQQLHEQEVPKSNEENKENNLPANTKDQDNVATTTAATPASHETIPLWLKDLIQLKSSRGNCSTSSSGSVSDINNESEKSSSASVKKCANGGNLPCSYCLHLFSNQTDLEEHTRLLHSSKSDEIVLKFTPPAVVTPQ
ncbi:uncharacterized protein isoform X2 [Musca autumnalis]